MSVVISPGVAAAITGELLTGAIRFYFLYQRMQALQGMTPEEAEVQYQLKKAEFEKRPPAALQALIDVQG